MTRIIKHSCNVINPGDWVRVGSLKEHCLVFKDGRWVKGDGSEIGYWRAIHSHRQYDPGVWGVWPPNVELEREDPDARVYRDQGVWWLCEGEAAYETDYILEFRPE